MKGIEGDTDLGGRDGVTDSLYKEVLFTG